MLLESLFRKFGEVFCSFLGFEYKQSAKHKFQLMNVILGQTKKAIYVSRRRKTDDSVDIDVTLLFTRIMKARIMIDFNYYKEMKDVDQFSIIWAHGDVLCSVKEKQLIFSA